MLITIHPYKSPSHPMWHIKFESARFQPFLPDACQINGSVYGYELALWLTQELAAQGINTSYPAIEEWGWFIEFMHEGRSILIGCNGEAQNPGERPRNWRIYVQAQLSMAQRLRGEHADTALANVVKAIEALLTRESITYSPH